MTVMTRLSKTRIAGIAWAVVAATLGTVVAVAQLAELPTAPPACVGFSADRLKLLDAAMQKLVDERALSGIVTLLARRGKIVATNVYGYQDIAKKTPMRQDTIFRIYS